MLIFVEYAAEPVPSADNETRESLRIGDRSDSCRFRLKTDPVVPGNSRIKIQPELTQIASAEMRQP